jgi:hypothetical protein
MENQPHNSPHHQPSPSEVSNNREMMDNINPVQQPATTPYVPADVPQQQFGVAQPQVVQANIAPPAPVNQPHQPTNTGAIVMQWLTYAFWGWTVLAMSFLTATVLSSFIGDSDTNFFTPYAIAAILVLLPISIVCDHFYSKEEPAKKTGAASIVLVIHAVLFALFGIGSLIAAVISIVTMITSSSESNASVIALLSSIIIFVLYSALFLRTINPPKFPMIRRLFMIFMIAVVGIIATLGLLGPVAKARQTRTDKLIEQNLSYVSNAVNTYATNNKKLPDNLNNVNLSGDAKKLVSDNLVTYKPNTKSSTIEPSSNSLYQNNFTSPTNTTTGASLTSGRTTFYYQLCVIYKKSSNDKYGSSNYSSSLNDTDGYSTYLSAYSHGEGETCYKLQTTPYNY